MTVIKCSAQFRVILHPTTSHAASSITVMMFLTNHTSSFYKAKFKAFDFFSCSLKQYHYAPHHTVWCYDECDQVLPTRSPKHARCRNETFYKIFILIKYSEHITWCIYIMTYLYFLVHARTLGISSEWVKIYRYATYNSGLSSLHLFCKLPRCEEVSVAGGLNGLV